VSQTKTSHDLWTLLKNTYAKASRNHLKQLKEHLLTASKGTQSITTYMHFLKQTCDLLASLGSLVSIEDMTEKLLIQELSIAIVQQQSPAPLTALNAQVRSNYNKPCPAQLPTQSNQLPGNRKPFLGKCHRCNVKGHVLSHCRTVRQQHPGIPPPPRDSPQVNIATASPP